MEVKWLFLKYLTELFYYLQQALVVLENPFHNNMDVLQEVNLSSHVPFLHHFPLLILLILISKVWSCIFRYRVGQYAVSRYSAAKRQVGTCNIFVHKTAKLVRTVTPNFFWTTNTLMDLKTAHGTHITARF